MRPFNASLPMALLSAREVAMRFFRPLLADHDLTEQQWRVLRALSAADEPLDAGALAETTCLLPPSLSRILDHLEGIDFVTRGADPNDQRRALLSLSGAGRAKVREVAPESERRYAAIEAEFGSDRLQSLLDELHQFIAVADASSEASDDAA